MEFIEICPYVDVDLQLKAGDSPSLQALKDAIPKWYTVCDQLNNKISNYQKETSEKVSNMGKTLSVLLEESTRKTTSLHRQDKTHFIARFACSILSVNSQGSLRCTYYSEA